ncbi:hypothetical protein ZWY2020_022539 [Hordeum vulgare]|nr:hypothetical protein ZWY2020_022539 [Hordeum vulgare]
MDGWPGQRGGAQHPRRFAKRGKRVWQPKATPPVAAPAKAAVPAAACPTGSEAPPAGEHPLAQNPPTTAARTNDDSNPMSPSTGSCGPIGPSNAATNQGAPRDQEDPPPCSEVPVTQPAGPICAPGIDPVSGQSGDSPGSRRATGLEPSR